MEKPALGAADFRFDRIVSCEPAKRLIGACLDSALSRAVVIRETRTFPRAIKWCLRRSCDVGWCGSRARRVVGGRMLIGQLVGRGGPAGEEVEGLFGAAAGFGGEDRQS